MGLFKRNPGKKTAKQANKAASKASRREFKLAKKEIRGDKARDRQNTRITKVETRQAGKTDRTNIRQTEQSRRVETRQTGKTIRNISQDQADMVAYENGMTPINRTAGIINAAGGAAGQIGGALADIGGGGLLGGGGGNDSYNPYPPIRERETMVDSSGGQYANPAVVAAPMSPMMIFGAIAAVIAAIFFMNKNKRK